MSTSPAFVGLLAGALFLLARPPAGAAEPIRLHPDNPHYFLWRGKPVILITSAEHYGGVLNPDLDYVKYLATLASDGMNYTRIFSGGTYVEPLGAFNIPRNTLAPRGDRFLAPWARSETPGYAGGGNKFDLDRWSEAYFARLKGFVAEAGKQGIVVELSIFCPFYEESQWALSPVNAKNNVNGTPEVQRTDVYTLDKSGSLLKVQERLVRKLVEELRDADNVFFEISNEPYFGGVTLEWQHRVADWISDAQKDHPHRKLVAQNIANGSARVVDPHPAVSILNFHYASPPVTVAMNYALNRVIGDDETGFRGTHNSPYRMEGWDFVVAGGGLYNNLDYSFNAGHEDGTFVLPAGTPGGGGPGLRRELRALRDFMHRFEFVRMRPDDAVLRGALPAGLTARALVEAGKQYAVYLRSAQLPGQFSTRWTGTITPPASGRYTLHTESNDGVRLWLDDKLVIDNWTEHPTTEDKAEVELDATRAHKLKVEFFYAGGQMTMKLSWSAAGLAKELMPASAFQTTGGQPGLEAEYFADMTLTARSRKAVEAQIKLESPGGEGGQLRMKSDEVEVQLELPAGAYTAEWVDTKTGSVLRRESLEHPGGRRALRAPAFDDDVALAVQAAK